MASSTPGPTGSTWKPKSERGAYAAAARRQRVFVNLTTQSLLAVGLLVAAAFSRSDALAVKLYVWAAVVPIGFAVVFVTAWRRGERARSAGTWTPEWETSAARRSYALLGLVAVAWIAGSLAILSLA